MLGLLTNIIGRTEAPLEVQPAGSMGVRLEVQPAESIGVR